MRCTLWSFFFVTLALAGACGTSSSAPASPGYDINGGDGVSIGAGGAGAAGSSGTTTDAAAPMSPVGAVDFHYGASPSYPNAMCPAGSSQIAVGTVDGASETLGEGASVGCSVQSTSDGWSFTGGVTDASTGVTFSISGSIAMNGVGTASVQVSTPTPANVMYSSPPITPCNVAITSALGAALAVTSDSIWAAFDCPVLQSAASDPGKDACAIVGTAAITDPDAGMNADAGTLFSPGGYFYFTSCNVD
jgi:hypothetical protein